MVIGGPSVEELKHFEVKARNCWNELCDSAFGRSSRNTSEGVDGCGKVNPRRGEAVAKASVRSSFLNEGQSINVLKSQTSDLKPGDLFLCRLKSPFRGMEDRNRC